MPPFMRAPLIPEPLYTRPAIPARALVRQLARLSWFSRSLRGYPAKAEVNRQHFRGTVRSAGIWFSSRLPSCRF